MAIKFKCPNPDCGQALSVKDESLAGRKIGCPKCKKVVVIPKPTPAPAAAPAEDVEALAAAALGEDRAEAAAGPATQTIDFECPQCGEQIKMSRDLAGKNAPCPECRRIIKVPVPKTKEGAEWRQKDNKPLAARRDTEPPPEGAWESSRAKGVSAQALIEAGLAPKKRRPGLTRRQKIYRGIYAGTAGVVLLVGGLFAWSAWSQNKQGDLVEKAVKAAEDQAKSKEPAAEANRAAGEYYLRTGGHESADKAHKHFGKARSLLSPASSQPGPAVDLLLADLAVSQLDLGGSDVEARNGTRMKWGEVLKDVRSTREQIASPGGRLHAHRLIGRKLIALGRADDASTLAGVSPPAPKPEDKDNVDAGYEGPEALALVGIELFRAGEKDKAATLAGRVAQPYAAPADNPGRPPLSPSAVALCLATGKPEPQPGKSEEDKGLQGAGRAAGRALKGDVTTARDVAKRLPPEAQFRALVMLAEVTGEAADVEAAAGLLGGDVKADQPGVPWLIYRLATVATKLGGSERVMGLAVHAADPGLRDRIWFETVRMRVDNTKGQADTDLGGYLGGLEREKVGPLFPALCREALARHNGKLDYNGTIKAVQGWDEAVRPFGTLGAVLGDQDGKGK
jgi:hypothetical protein